MIMIQILKQKKSNSCGHSMPKWGNQMYCFKCREARKNDDLCTHKQAMLQKIIAHNNLSAQYTRQTKKML